MSDSANPWIAAHQASLSITNSQILLKLMSIELVTSSNNLVLCHLLFLPSIFPSIRVFANESVLHIRWPKYWSFSFNISPTNEHPGLIFFRMDWFLLAVQGTLKSLLQHNSSKASILQHSALFIVQLSWTICFSVTLAFLMIQQMLSIWFLVPLPFLNPACTSGRSQFIYWWSLAWFWALPC